MRPRLSRRAFAARLGLGALTGLGWTRRAAGAPSPTSLDALDLTAAAAAIAARKLSPVDLTRHCLERITRLDGRVNAFVTVTAEQALADARRAEDELAHGRSRGALHGIPIGIKDNVDTAGVRTTAASAVFADRVPARDAPLVTHLREAGAVLVGKLNMHELALGTTSAISHFGAVHNPWDLERTPGGSSGGSGAAVAAGFCLGAVGTDTGGSIRVPASACGIVGLKPTFGVVSTEGVVLLSEEFDHAGPMCRTVSDTARLFRALTDHPIAREFDPDRPADVSRLRVGTLPIRDLCETTADPEVQAAFDAAVDVLRSLVAEVHAETLPSPNELGLLIAAETWGRHAATLAAHPELYDARTRESILEGRGVTPEELTRLRGALARHRATPAATFARVDVVAVPTIPRPPERIREATKPFAVDSCTFAFSVGGWPALSVPCGFTRGGLPIGLLLGGPPFSEPRLLALALAYERSTPWHERRPALGA